MLSFLAVPASAAYALIAAVAAIICLLFLIKAGPAPRDDLFGSDLAARPRAEARP